MFGKFRRFIYHDNDIPEGYHDRNYNYVSIDECADISAPVISAPAFSDPAISAPVRSIGGQTLRVSVHDASYANDVAVYILY